MNNIEYKWVGEHHAAIIVNEVVGAYINKDRRSLEWVLHFPQEQSYQTLKRNTIKDMEELVKEIFDAS